jgi:hypothetical protein
MPIRKGKSKKVFNYNINELMTGKIGKARKKGMKTLAKRKGISLKNAKRKQAVAISYAIKRKGK